MYWVTDWTFTSGLFCFIKGCDLLLFFLIHHCLFTGTIWLFELFGMNHWQRWCLWCIHTWHCHLWVMAVPGWVIYEPFKIFGTGRFWVLYIVHRHWVNWWHFLIGFERSFCCYFLKSLLTYGLLTSNRCWRIIPGEKFLFISTYIIHSKITVQCSSWLWILKEAGCVTINNLLVSVSDIS